MLVELRAGNESLESPEYGESIHSIYHNLGELTN